MVVQNDPFVHGQVGDVLGHVEVSGVVVESHVEEPEVVLQHHDQVRQLLRVAIVLSFLFAVVLMRMGTL